MQEQWRKNAERRTRDARRHFLGAAAVYKDEQQQVAPAMTEKEQQIRWIVPIFEEHQHLDPWGMPMGVLYHLQFVCLTQIGRELRMLLNEEEAPEETPPEATYPNEDRWLRVLFEVFEVALAEIEEDPREGLNFESEGGILLEALKNGCWTLMNTPLRQPKSHHDNDEKKQVRALLGVLEEVRSCSNLPWGDEMQLLGLLQRRCQETLEGDLEGQAQGGLGERSEGDL